MRSAVACALLISAAGIAGERTRKTYDGRTIAGTVVLESERGILLRTEAGNVLVPWVDIEADAANPSTNAHLAAHEESTPALPSKHRLGLAIGVGAGPTMTDLSDRLWVAAEASFFIDLNFNMVGLRFAVPIQFGIVSYRSSPQLFAGLDTQLRLNFSRQVSLGVGGEVGFGAARFSGVLRGYLAIGPTLTPVAVRWGESLRHEISVEGSVQFSSFNGTFGYAGSLFVARYAYLF